MILSHKHRFVFINGMKVAGTSAEIALSKADFRANCLS
jgi:hypothetical protein